MKRFGTFGEYMFDLLFGPLKKGKRAVNQFFIFFKVIGRQFDDVKRAFFRAREEANVVSCSEIMLPVHGQDRDMPRLEGEDAEAYRTRLSMKGIISAWGGTRQGILYALTALGYEESRIEPVSYHDPDRWAEFIIFLGGKYPSGVNDINIIDAEVRKVKEGSSRPAYGLEERTIVEIREWSRVGEYGFPICGRLKCGQHPGKNNHVGYLLRSRESLLGSEYRGKFLYVLCGTIRAQKPPYIKGDIILGRLAKTAAELRTANHEGRFAYILSGASRLSQGEDNGRAGASQVELAIEYHEGRFIYKRPSQGEDNGRPEPSQVETVQEYMVGSLCYPRAGQYRAGQKRKE